MHRTGHITGDNSLRIITIVLLSMFFIGCASYAEPQENQYELGWYHGSCLALNEAKPNADWYIFLLKESKDIVKARLGKQIEDDSCAPLLEDRREVNRAEGYSFYQLVSSEVIADDEIGVAVLTEQEILPEKIDANNNKQADNFSYCTTSEGLIFYGWDAKKGALEPFWQEYYYLGYNVEPSCNF